MEIIGLIVLGIILLGVYNAGFSSGKRLGSRKGYGVGFDRGRRGHNSSGCLVVVLAGLACAVAAAALAMF
jgi:hypothetical protein